MCKTTRNIFTCIVTRVALARGQREDHCVIVDEGFILLCREWYTRTLRRDVLHKPPGEQQEQTTRSGDRYCVGLQSGG